MSKIKGKFAPLTEELGYDDRFKLNLTDFEKLMYLLIIHTTHMTHHRASADPRYYQLQYGVKARSAHIQHAIETLKSTFPKLKCIDGKLSLLNSTTYKNEKRLEVEVETEVEEEGTQTKTEIKKNKKPDIEEVKALFREKGFPAEAEKFFDYYEANGWRVGKNPMRKWQSAVANWIRQGQSYGQIAKPKNERILKPKAGCPACDGTGKMVKGEAIGAKCWCWS